MSKQALVIDNDFFFVEFIKELLEKRGYSVRQAYDGKEGIARLEEGVVDVLIVDIVIPKIDGQQVIKFARHKYPHDPFPIVAISGSIIERLDRLKEIGATCFLAKGPLEKMTDQINDLMESIEQKKLDEVGEEELFDQGDLFPRTETAELLDTLSFHKAIIECIGLGVVVVDRDGRIITTNTRVLELVGKPIEEMLNQPIVTVFDGPQRPQIISALKKLIRNQALGKITLAASIDSKPVPTTLSLLKLDHKIAGFIIILED